MMKKNITFCFIDFYDYYYYYCMFSLLRGEIIGMAQTMNSIPLRFVLYLEFFFFVNLVNGISEEKRYLFRRCHLNSMENGELPKTLTHMRSRFERKKNEFPSISWNDFLNFYSKYFSSQNIYYYRFRSANKIQRATSSLIYDIFIWLKRNTLHRILIQKNYFVLLFVRKNFFNENWFEWRHGLWILIQPISVTITIHKFSTHMYAFNSLSQIKSNLASYAYLPFTKLNK